MNFTASCACGQMISLYASRTDLPAAAVLSLNGSNAFESKQSGRLVFLTVGLIVAENPKSSDLISCQLCPTILRNCFGFH